MKEAEFNKLASELRNQHNFEVGAGFVFTMVGGDCLELEYFEGKAHLSLSNFRTEEVVKDFGVMGNPAITKDLVLRVEAEARKKL